MTQHSPFVPHKTYTNLTQLDFASPSRKDCFCSGVTPTQISPAIGRANRRLRRASDENSETAVWLYPSNKDQDGGLSSWAFKMCHLQPFRSILFKNFSNFCTLILGAHSYYPRGPIMRKSGIIQLWMRMRSRGFSAWGIQAVPFASF